MKIPPLNEMEPLPPVPSCSKDLSPEDISSVAEQVEEGEFEEDSDSDSDYDGVMDDQIRPVKRRAEDSSLMEPGIETVVRNVFENKLENYSIYLYRDLNSDPVMNLICLYCCNLQVLNF